MTSESIEKGASVAFEARQAFGQRLEKHLTDGTRPPGSERKRWTNKEFAAIFGMDDDQIINWKKGRHVPNGRRFVLVLSAFFGKERSKLEPKQRNDWDELRKLWTQADSEQTAEQNARKLDCNSDSGQGPNRPNVENRRTLHKNTKPIRKITNLAVRRPKHFADAHNLARIREKFEFNRSHPSIVALYGLPGVGKTTLAAFYAQQESGRYNVVWRVRARDHDTMQQDLISLGRRLGWISGQQGDHALLTTVECLSRVNDDIIVIYDGALDPKSLSKYLPFDGGSNIIITSNNFAWRDVADPIEIHPWGKTEGAEFLLSRSGRGDDRVIAEALSQALGGHALAHEMAAAYCEQREISLKTYNDRFNEKPPSFLSGNQFVPLEYGKSVTKAIALAMEGAADRHTSAAVLLVYVSCLAAKPVPLFLLFEGREWLAKNIVALESDGSLEEAIAALRSFSLVDREATLGPFGLEIESITLHRLVKEIASSHLDAELGRRAQASLFHAFMKVFPAEYSEDREVWDRCDALTSHLLELCMIPSDSDMDAGRAQLFHLLARHCVAIGLNSGAIDLLEQATEIYESGFDADDQVMVIVRNELAAAYLENGEIIIAEEIYRDTLSIAERLAGSNPDLLIQCLLGSIDVYQIKSQFAEAKSGCERLFTFFENNGGAEPAILGAVYEKLGDALMYLNQLSEAEESLRTAIALYRETNSARLLGPALDKLGVVLFVLNKSKEAEQLYHVSIQVMSSTFTSAYPKLAIVLCHLAILLADTGRIKKAVPLARRAVVVGACHNYGLDRRQPDRELMKFLVQNYGNILRESKLDESDVEAAIAGALESASIANDNLLAAASSTQI